MVKISRAGTKCGKQRTRWRENWKAELRGLLESKTQSPHRLGLSNSAQGQGAGSRMSFVFFVVVSNVDCSNNLAFDS